MVNDYFVRKANQDVDRARKLFWKDVSKVESCDRIKDGNGTLAQG